MGISPSRAIPADERRGKVYMEQRDKLKIIGRILSIITLLLSVAAIITTLTKRIYWPAIPAFSFIYISEIFRLFRRARQIRAEDERASLRGIFLEAGAATCLFAFWMYVMLSLMQRV